MTQTASQQQATWNRVVHTCNGKLCHGESVIIETPAGKEIFVRLAPNSNAIAEDLHRASDKVETEAEPDNTADASQQEEGKRNNGRSTGNLHFQRQTQYLYEELPKLLAQAGASMQNVVYERVFFQNIHEDMGVFKSIRKVAYEAAGIEDVDFPATNYLQQPPYQQPPGQATQKIEMQVYVVVPNAEVGGRVRTFLSPDDDTITKLVEFGGYQHLYIANINGHRQDERRDAPFREQCDDLFAKTKRMLSRQGVQFRRVLRTWCYLADIDRDYAEFNLSRSEFFKQEKITRLPASTGIEADLAPAGTLVGLDLYALMNPEGVTIEVMHTPTLNEADEYGSDFSRGMKVAFPDKTVLYLSGTASIDEQGETVHLDDSRKQIERMLLNVRELLEPYGATFADVTQMTTYLKNIEDYDLFRIICGEWGIQDAPNTIVECGVCRPELLCEIEATAIIPTQPKKKGSAKVKGQGTDSPSKGKGRSKTKSSVIIHTEANGKVKQPHIAKKGTKRTKRS